MGKIKDKVIKKIKRSMRPIKTDNLIYKGLRIQNHFRIWTDEGIYYQAHESIVGFKAVDGGVLFDEKYWEYNPEISSWFLAEEKSSVEEKIKNNEYKLTNLCRILP